MPSAAVVLPPFPSFSPSMLWGPRVREWRRASDPRAPHPRSPAGARAAASSSSGFSRVRPPHLLLNLSLFKTDKPRDIFPAMVCGRGRSMFAAKEKGPRERRMYRGDARIPRSIRKARRRTTRSAVLVSRVAFTTRTTKPSRATTTHRIPFVTQRVPRRCRWC